jgi:hypothetical protein
MEHDYSVSFFKRLVDSYGRTVDACQGTVEVRAADQVLATERAKQEFARLKDVRDWSLRGDYAKVVPTSSQKRAAKRAKRDTPTISA